MDYDEEQRAWDAERKRLAARPWWKKAWDWQADEAERYRVALYVISGAVFVVLVYVLVRTIAHVVFQ